MIKKFTAVFCLLYSVTAYSQQVDTVKGKLLELKRPVIVGYNYVNFDVLKMLVGHSQSIYKGRYRLSVSFEGQVLWPVAFMKDIIPTALGISFGSAKISMPHTELIFVDDRLAEIKRNDKMNASVQRTGHIGFIIMPVVKQFKRSGLTLLAGISADWNTSSNILIRSASGATKKSTRNYINRLSCPMHAQLSWSPLQFFSGGVFVSYDTKARFKGSEFNGMKQMILGLSAAVIL